MTPLENIAEPQRLLMTWQRLDDGGPRTRRVIGVVEPLGSDSYRFQYLSHTEDYEQAIASGFEGYPAFKQQEGEITNGVFEALAKRLPPRSREDFADYLAAHRLPSPFPGSVFALLGYTRARLPSDGFELIPEFEGDAGPLDLIIELAGVRHVFGIDVSSISVGDEVTFRLDDSNEVDPDAVLVFHSARRLGFVNRALRGQLARWMSTHDVTGTVERFNGKPDRPLIFVRLRVRPKS